MRNLLIGFIFASFLLFCSTSKPIDENIKLVYGKISSNPFNLKMQGFSTKINPKGEGIFVYIPNTQFSGTKRNFVWLVLDNEIFPLNGASKQLTPSSSWPREIDQNLWSKTGLNPLMASEAIEILYGN